MEKPSIQSEVFVDSLISIAMRDGVVRLEFGTIAIEPEKGSDEKSKEARELTPKHRMFMTVPGYARSVEIMQKLMDQMKEGYAQQQKQRPEAVSGVPSGNVKPFIAESPKS